MIFVVRQPNGREFDVHADQLCVESGGKGTYRFKGHDAVFLELPATEVEHVRLVDEHPLDEEPLEPRVPMRSG